MKKIFVLAAALVMTGAVAHAQTTPTSTTGDPSAPVSTTVASPTAAEANSLYKQQHAQAGDAHQATRASKNAYKEQERALKDQKSQMRAQRAQAKMAKEQLKQQRTSEKAVKQQERATKAEARAAKKLEKASN